jgi:hypothetical protein
MQQSNRMDRYAVRTVDCVVMVGMDSVASLGYCGRQDAIGNGQSASSIDHALEQCGKG